jgi:hypothetical protein
MTARITYCLLLGLLFSWSAIAEESAEVVGTDGGAQLETVHDFLLFSSSTKTPARVPQHISVGTLIHVSYIKDGRVDEADFAAVDIAIRGDLCWIHIKQRSRYDSTLGDTLYVQPCRKLR